MCEYGVECLGAHSCCNLIVHSPTTHSTYIATFPAFDCVVAPENLGRFFESVDQFSVLAEAFRALDNVVVQFVGFCFFVVKDCGKYASR